MPNSLEEMHVRNAISDDTAITVAQALVSSRFDYANSILYGAPKYNISKLQRAQNVLARVVTRVVTTNKCGRICCINFTGCLLKT